MSGWKNSGKRVKTTSVLLALIALSSQYGMAQDAPNRVTDITVSPRGELIINVDGEGFDPILRLEPTPNGEFRIVVQGQGVTLAPGLTQTSAHLGGDLHGKIPAIEGARLSGASASGSGFQLVLTSWRKLQPQILSNDGHQIVISLVGNRSLPPAVVQRRYLAEQQRIALQKKQATLKAQVALQHQAELQRQAAQQHLAALQKQQEAQHLNEQRQQAAQQRLAAAVQKQKSAQHYSNLEHLSQPKLQAEMPELQDEAQYQAELQKEKTALEAQRRQALAHKGAVESNGWQTAYTPPSSMGPINQLQLAHRGGKSATLKHLVQEMNPAPPAIISQPHPMPSVQTVVQPHAQSVAQPLAQPQVESSNLIGPTGSSTDETPMPQQNEIKLSPNPAQVLGVYGGQLNSIYAVVNAPNTHASLRNSWKELMNGNALAAQATLRQRLKSTPDDVNARYLLAQILLSPLLDNPNATPTETAQALTARREEARQELLKNYAQSLHWPSCQTLLELFLDEGKLEEASRLLAQASRAYPHEAGVAFEQGRLQEALVDLDAARAAYQQALSLQPDNPEMHYRLAQVELKSSHLEAARWELLQALTWSPNDSRLYKLLGYIADKTGQASQAAQAYRQALPVDALINYARALEAQNQPERALSLYQAVEALAGDNGDILYTLAMIYTNTHRPARATTVLTRFLALGGDQRDARVSKAQALLKQLSNPK